MAYHKSCIVGRIVRSEEFRSCEPSKSPDLEEHPSPRFYTLAFLGSGPLRPLKIPMRLSFSLDVAEACLERKPAFELAVEAFHPHSHHRELHAL